MPDALLARFGFVQYPYNQTLFTIEFTIHQAAYHRLFEDLIKDTCAGRVSQLSQKKGRQERQDDDNK